MPTVALAMIVRNAGVHLERCLASVQGAVDEIVIGDTGSRDETPQRARQLGARVLHVPWEDDFARARNRVLEAVTADWVLVLDADERLDASGREEIPVLIQVAGCDGYLVTIRNYVFTLAHRLWDTPAVPNDHRLPEADPYPGYVAHENVRLFRRRPEVYFVGRVHETVGGRISSWAGSSDVPASSFTISDWWLIRRRRRRRRSCIAGWGGRRSSSGRTMRRRISSWAWWSSITITTTPRRPGCSSRPVGSIPAWPWAGCSWVWPGPGWASTGARWRRMRRHGGWATACRCWMKPKGMPATTGATSSRRGVATGAHSRRRSGGPSC